MAAVLRAVADYHPSPRDKHITLIAVKGRLGWKKETGYDRRSLVETTMGRYKAIIGPNLRVRSLPGQRAKAAVGQTPPAIEAWPSGTLLGGGTLDQTNIRATTLS